MRYYIQLRSAGSGSSGAPVWEIVPNITSPAGAFSQDIGQYASDPNDDPLLFSISPSSPSSEAQIAAAGLTLDGETGILSGTYNGSTLAVIVRATEHNTSLLDDWIARSTGAGVVWAERFNNASTWNRWVFGDGTGATSRVATDGIMGDGCFQHQCTPTITPDGGFARPLKPVNGNGTTVPHDINNAGLYHDGTTVITQADGVTEYSNGRGGFFGHASYHNNPNWDNTTLHPPPYRAYIGTDYYVQFRVKFSPGRFTVGETDGKIAMMHLIYNTTPRSELVMHARTNFGGRWFNMYTGAGTPHLLCADYPDSDDGTSIQPGGPKESTCLFGIGDNAGNPSFCWLWPENEWLTVLVHIIPGTHAPDYSNPVEHRNTGIEVWVASQSRINALGTNAYELIHRKLDYAIMQDPQPYSGGFFPDQYGSNPRTVNGFGQPPGSSIFALNGFNGGATLRPSVQPGGWWHRYDQVICSTQFIPCPAV